MSVASLDRVTAFIDNPAKVGIADIFEGCLFHEAGVWDIYLKNCG
jgi:hypothetical protein